MVAWSKREGKELPCVRCGTVKYFSPGDLERNSRFCSHECADLSNRGENNVNWRGGVTTLRKQIRECAAYKKWHKAVMERDDYTCQLCQQRGGDKEVDHIVSFAILMIQGNVQTLEEALAYEPLWDVGNGRCLCPPCHKTTDTWGQGTRNLLPALDAEQSDVESGIEIIPIIPEDPTQG